MQKCRAQVECGFLSYNKIPRNKLGCHLTEESLSGIVVRPDFTGQLRYMDKLCIRAAGLFLFLMSCLLAPAPASGQIIITNFAGLSLSDTSSLGQPSTPPDTMGAAGTNQFVEFINGGFTVFSKSSVRQSFVSDSNFWVSAGISPGTMAAGLTDTRITYDAGSGRWFATELTEDTTGNKVLVARSDSSNPSGTWKAASFTASARGFGDFDTLGVDSVGVYIAVDDFNIFNRFTGVSLFSIPKADLLAATPTLANMTKFNNLNANAYGFALQGANNPGAGSGHGVIIAIDNQYLNQFERTTVNNPGAAADVVRCNCRSLRLRRFPNPQAQPGGQQVDGGDDRFSAAVRQIGGYVFMANTVLNSTNNRDAVHWMVLNETNNTVTSEGIVTDANYDFTYPSIAASHSGKVLMAFNRIGTTAPAGDISIFAVVGTVSNCIVTMGSPFVLKAGSVSNFTISFDSQPYRWGDY